MILQNTVKKFIINYNIIKMSSALTAVNAELYTIQNQSACYNKTQNYV